MYNHYKCKYIGQRNAKLETLTLEILFDYDFRKEKQVVFKIQCSLEILDERN